MDRACVDALTHGFIFLDMLFAFSSRMSIFVSIALSFVLTWLTTSKMLCINGHLSSTAQCAS